MPVEPSPQTVACDASRRRSTGVETEREQHARLQAILDASVEAIVTISEQGVCESFNRAAEKMFGYAADEVLGQNVSLLMPSPYREEHDRYVAEYLRTGVKKIIGIGRDVTGLRKNGEEFPIYLAVSEVRLAERRLFTGFIQDLTDRKAAERRLVQAERLAVLGEATARLAHEGRNVLQRIQIGVETAQLYCDATSPLGEQLAAIERASDGLDALLDELKNYGAPLHLERAQTSLSAVWREAWQTVCEQHPERSAVLQESLCDDAVRADVDGYRMGQVFRNIFENSFAAHAGSLEVTIDVEAASTAEVLAWRVRIRDNGPGVDAAQAAHIFEPFYTTKTKGVGLGLPIAQRIVEAHRGELTLGNCSGAGAEFVIRLPG